MEDDVIVIEVDAAGIVVDVCGGAARLLGAETTHLVDRALVDCINPSDTERLHDGIDFAPTSSGSGRSSATLRLLDDRARSVWVRLSVVPDEPRCAPATAVLHARPFRPADAAVVDVTDPNPYHALVQRSADIVMIVDPDGTIRFVNSAMLRLLGMEPDDLIGVQVLTIIHPDDHDEVTDVVVRLLEKPGKPQPFEFRARHVDGTYRWVDGWLQNLMAHPGVGGLLGNGRDVTDRYHAQMALAASEARFRSLASSSPSAIFELDDDGVVRFANDRWYEITGRRVTATRDVFDVMDRDDAERLRRIWAAGVGDGGLDAEVRVVRADGELRWVELRTRPVYDPDSDTTTHVGSLHDVTEIRDAHSELEYRAKHDALTHLPNRGLLLERLAVAVEQSRRTGAQLALLFVDLDRFKVVNDSLGHHAGDEVLQAVAGRLADLVRPDDVVARFGGDEFVILCAPISDEDQAAILAERIRREAAGGVEVDGEVVHVTLSVGFVIGGGESSPGSLLRDADSAMYEAKTRGRDRAQAFDEAMHRAAVERLEIETGLRRGVERDEFQVYFQPIVDVASARVAGVEALLRWDHPRRGLLVADDFLDIAAESGVLAQLSAWVLATACGHAAGWASQPGMDAPQLFVNLSADQLDDPRLPAVVAEVLADTGLDAPRLVLEVTEGMLMADPDDVAELLDTLRGLDVHIAVDDFGTGYSSLSYLTRLPVDVLKIDQSFVAGLGSSATDREVVAAIVALAHALGLRAVAEGVETAAQLDTLVQLGCDLAQGFLFSEPLSPERLSGWLAAHPVQDAR